MAYRYKVPCLVRLQWKKRARSELTGSGEDEIRAVKETLCSNDDDLIRLRVRVPYCTVSSIVLHRLHQLDGWSTVR